MPVDIIVSLKPADCRAQRAGKSSCHYDTPFKGILQESILTKVVGASAKKCGTSPQGGEDAWRSGGQQRKFLTELREKCNTESS